MHVSEIWRFSPAGAVMLCHLFTASCGLVGKEDSPDEILSSVYTICAMKAMDAVGFGELVSKYNGVKGCRSYYLSEYIKHEARSYVAAVQIVEGRLGFHCDLSDVKAICERTQQNPTIYTNIGAAHVDSEIHWDVEVRDLGENKFDLKSKYIPDI